MKQALIFDVFFTFSNPLNCCKLLKNKTRKSGHIHASISSLCGAPPQDGQDPGNKSPFDLAYGTTQMNSLAEREMVAVRCRAPAEDQSRFDCFSPDSLTLFYVLAG